jgi:site-specific DNA-methyltransferase (adenine-specific)
MDINKIYNLDCRDGLKEIANNTVSLCVTSPPYKDSDGFKYELMTDVFTQLYRVLKPGSLFFLNFGALAEDKFRPFKVCEAAMGVGFRLNETITWVKNHYRPIQGSKRLNNLTEFIFLLHKGDMPNLDRLGVGIPYSDISNAKRFNDGLNLKCRGNVWYINYETINNKEEKLHNDRFPLELPELCIKLSGIKNDQIIIDPFSGSGTTCLAAKRLNKQYIGFEKNPRYYDIAVRRLAI